ncbi:MAG: F0F1 ATP synthase subunit B [Pirellulales bacterium]
MSTGSSGFLRWGVDVMNAGLRSSLAAGTVMGCLAWIGFGGMWTDGTARAADPPAAATPPAAAPEKAPAEKAPAEKAPTADSAAPAQTAEKPAADQPAADKPAPAAEKSADAEQPAAAPGEAKPAAQPAGDPPVHAETSAAGGADEKAAHGDDSHGGGGGHGHHDPTDLSHANDGPGHANLAPRALTGIQELKSDLAIYTFVVFLLLLGVLLKFGWKPIMAGLDKREQGIRDLIAQTERNSAEAAAALRQHQSQLAAAADEARELLSQARREAEKAREEILAEARTAAQRERDRALEDIAAAKNLALREIAQKSVNTAVGLAGRILQREVSTADHAALIQEALEQFPSRN